jgi:hypothetical protein
VVFAGAVAGGDPDNLGVTFDFSPQDWSEKASSEGWEHAGGVTVRSEEPYEQWESGQEDLAGFNLPDGLDPAEIDITADPVAGTFAFACPDS